MRHFQGLNPEEYTFVNNAVRIGYSKTKGRKAFFALRQIQNSGFETWEQNHSTEAREWQQEIIIAAGFQKVFEGYDGPNEGASDEPEQPSIL